MENRLFRYYSEVEPQPVDWLWYPALWEDYPLAGGPRRR